jgi:hypothetical protein
MEKKCNCCGVVKSLEDFTMRHTPYGLRPRTFCRPCFNKRITESPNYKARVKRQVKKRNAQDKEERKGIRPANAITEDARKQDRIKKRDFSLDRAFVRDIIEKPCFYCEDTTTRMTVDRIDNKIGHTKENVVQSCIRCNLTRGNMPFDAWLVVCKGMKEALAQGLFGDWQGR